MRTFVRDRAAERVFHRRDDRLPPGTGLAFGIALSLPFWAVVAILLWWLI